MQSPFVAAALTLAFVATACSGSQAGGDSCGEPGQWLVPTSGAPSPIAWADLSQRLADRQVVLLGERHDSAEDHRWQLHTLAQLHALRPTLAIGFEMFPRRIQPVLDDWVAGRLSEAEFLQRSEWEKVWGFSAADYLPLFHFARMNRIPMLALNVERSLTEAVGKDGWDAVPEERREGVGRPAPPSEAYRKALRRVFDDHPARKRGSDGFARFVEAQQVWDRAMAEAMAAHLRQRPQALVVGIVGGGHVRQGHGIAHQLRDLGVERIGALMTRERGDDCRRLGKDFADGLYVVAPAPANPPRLGVSTDAATEGLRVVAVAPGSIAERADLKPGDIILAVAGQPAKSFLTLRAAVQAMPAGAVLPLTIRRDGAEIEILARFPPAS